MKERKNALGQAIGTPVEHWAPRPSPPREPMVGRYCQVEPLDPDRHGADLHAANQEDADGRIWTYLAYGPFDSLSAYRGWLKADCAGSDPMFHAIVDAQSTKALGVASYLRIEPGTGVIEVGHINYAPRLQKTPAATEAMYLMMRRVFDELGYRRYEWKCDSLNAGSRGAAQRLGFQYEGTFRQATLYKGRNRDTAWYSIIDEEWPALKAAYEQWLAPDNFDNDGLQRRRLSELTAGARQG